jgi:hypothetical protein
VCDRPPVAVVKRETAHHIRRIGLDARGAIERRLGLRIAVRQRVGFRLNQSPLIARQFGPRRGKPGIQFNRPWQPRFLLSEPQAFARRIVECDVHRTRFQEQLTDRQIFRRPAFKKFFRRRRKRRPEDGRDGLRELGLKGAEARRRAFLVERTAPHVLVHGGADELPRDAHGAAQALHAAIEHGGDVALAPICGIFSSCRDRPSPTGAISPAAG